MPHCRVARIESVSTYVHAARRDGALRHNVVNPVLATPEKVVEVVCVCACVCVFYTASLCNIG